MSLRYLLAVALVCGLVSACASVPDVTISYYFPRAQTEIAVTQTIGCNDKVPNKHRSIRSVISVASTTSVSSDVDWLNKDGKPRQGHFHYKALSGAFNDSDATVTLTADGRLSGINATTAGQGGTALKNLVTAAGVIAAFGAPTPSGAFVPTDEDRACDEVDRFSVLQAVGSAAGKPAPSFVTLTYTATFGYDVATDGSPAFIVDQVVSPGYGQFSGRQTGLVLIPDAVSKPPYDALHTILADRLVTRLVVRSDGTSLRYLDAVPPKDDLKGAFLELSRVALINVAVTGRVADLTQDSQIWTSFIPAPTHAIYQIPIPKTDMLGKTAFGVALSDYGSITSLHYGSNTAALDVTDAFAALAKAAQPESDADRAKELQGKADLMAQQQRLIRCQLAPTQCM